MKKVMFISSVGGHLTQILELKKIFNNYEDGIKWLQENHPVRSGKIDTHLLIC